MAEKLHDSERTSLQMIQLLPSLCQRSLRCLGSDRVVQHDRFNGLVAKGDGGCGHFYELKSRSARATVLLNGIVPELSSSCTSLLRPVRSSCSASNMALRLCTLAESAKSSQLLVHVLKWKVSDLQLWEALGQMSPTVSRKQQR